MTPQLVASLSALLWEYYDAGEFLETIRLFIPDFKMPISFDRSKQEYLAVAKLLVDTADLGTTRVLLETLVAQLAIRNTAAIAKTSWQTRAAHETLTPHISGWEAVLAAAGLPSEIVVSARNPFTAKAELREFLEQATTPVLVVDTYVGPATLDCLRLTTQPIRLLTGTGAASIGSGFDAPLADFLTEGTR